MAIIKLVGAQSVQMAHNFLRKGFALTIIEQNGKKPVARNWQNDYFTDTQDAEYFKGQNLGFVLGVGSLHAVDIDLDCPEAITLARHFLSETNWIFGHKSAPRSHYMYRCDEAKTVKFSSPIKGAGEGMIVELRSTGAQTVAPGSVHPSGEPIRFEQKGWDQALPPKIGKDTLEQQCGDLAAACLVLRHGWVDGKRDEVAVALCGLMLRAGRNPDHIDNFLEAIAEAAGDEELPMRLKAEYQAKRLAENQKVPGIPSLIKHMGTELASTVVNWLGIQSLNVVNELNQEIGMVSMGGKARILVDGGYLSRGEFYTMSVSDAKNLYANRGETKLGKKKVTKFDYWLQSPERRTYSNLVFNPEGCGDNEYNLWQGWPLVPIRNPDGCKLFLRHVLEVICDGDEDVYDYILHWLADSLQNPRDKPGVALVMQSAEEGTGKTMFAQYVLRLFGQYGSVSTNSDHLFGKHNFHLAHKLMVFADESVWAGNHHHKAMLNNLITGNSLSFEPKGVDSFNLDNYLRLMMATNNDWAVPAGAFARRFCVVRVSNRYRRDWDYFEALKQEMKGDGPACLMKFLLDFKLTRNLNNIPMTDALRVNKLLTMHKESPIQAWWFKRLTEGTITKYARGWGDMVPIKFLYDDYLATLGRGEHGKSDETSFGINMARFAPAMKVVLRRASGISTMAGTVKPKYPKQRFRCYLLPSLDECRKYFVQTFLDGKYKWESSDEDGV